MKWYCYILKSNNPLKKNHTYNGSTNNLVRRLRQHNGEIVGGAKKTKIMQPNEFFCIISGFETQIEALQAEWRIKHPTKSKKRPSQYNGIVGRLESLNIILNDTVFTSKCTKKITDYNLTIQILEDYKVDLNIPANIKIIYEKTLSLK